MVRKIKFTKRFWIKSISIILLFLAAFCLIAARYKYIVFKDSQIDEIIFYFVNGLAGGKSDNLWSAVLQNLPLVLLLFGALLIPMFNKSISFINRIINLVLKKSNHHENLLCRF